jgi:lambda family phage portal protein
VGRVDRQTLRLECRDLWRNNEIVRAIVDRVPSYAVWTGIYPQPQTSDPAINAEYARWWAEIYVPTADYRQINGVDLIAHQRLAISHRLLDGGLGFVLLANGQIQPIEADRIATPQRLNGDEHVTEGVRVSDAGLVLGYYVCERNKNGTVDTTKARYIARENFIYLFNPSRVDQLVGIPDLAPCVNKLRDYDETDRYVLNKIKSDAMMLFKRKDDVGLPNMNPRGSTLKTSSSGVAQRVEKNEWGQVINLAGREDMEAFESKTPNGEYVPYLKHQLQTIAAAVGVSYEILMIIFTEGSFSSQRAALIHNKHAFLQWHDWLVVSFLDRLYNWRIAKAIKNGELPPAPKDAKGASEWWRKSWSVPHFDWVDPQKQAIADKERYNMGADSLTAIINSQGRYRDEVFAEKADDILAAARMAEEINKADPGAGVTWRDIILTAQPGQVSPSGNKPE